MTMPGLKLHLGCGKRFIPGFVHVDQGDFPHVDHRQDVGSLGFVPDGDADLIYASHVLEYFDRQEVRAVLGEWHRALRAGGLLRVAVPDFPALVRVYEQTQDLVRIQGPLYGRMETESDGQRRIIYHRAAYDFSSLKSTLEECGFTSVQRYDWRETIHKDHDDHSQAYFPHMDKAHGILVSLNVEATKSDK